MRERRATMKRRAKSLQLRKKARRRVRKKLLHPHQRHLQTTCGAPFASVWRSSRPAATRAWIGAQHGESGGRRGARRETLGKPWADAALCKPRANKLQDED